jgi:transmembrane sensor
MVLNVISGGVEDAEAAAAWVVRLADGEPDFAEFEAFEAWLAGGEGRAAAYDRALAAWNGTADSASAAAPAPPAARRPAARRIDWRIAGGAIAAATLGAIVFAWGLGRPEVYTTEPGARREVALRDGSRLQLNAATRVEVRWSAHARRVTLSEGEVAFDVAKDATRPFLIRSGQNTVTVVGTNFDVLARSGAYAVTVRRGVVEVKGGDSPAMRLQKGDRVDIAYAGAPLQRSRVDADDAFAWTTGRLVYRDASLGDVVKAVNLEFGPPRVAVDPAAARLRFSGVLMLDSREQVVRRLAQAVPLTIERQGPQLVLHRASPTR